MKNYTFLRTDTTVELKKLYYESIKNIFIADVSCVCSRLWIEYIELKWNAFIHIKMVDDIKIEIRKIF